MDIPISRLSEIDSYLKVAKKRGAETLSILGKLSRHFDHVFGTEVGKEILRLDIDRLDELLGKIWVEKATKQDLAEYRVLKRRVKREVDLIQQYLEKMNEVKQVVNAK